jgi:two-component system response regulator HydG
MPGSRGEATVPAPRNMPAILVADDDDSVRVTLAGNLELEGYQVSEARDGAEALGLIDQRVFDLIISDAAMPLATGIELLTSVRKAQLDTPFILVSGFVSEELVARALSEGLFALLDKPLATDRILAVVARALELNTVLMVNDSLPPASLLAKALRGMGMRIEACADGKSALDFVSHHAVDVCVVDFVKHLSDGPKLCQALRELDPGLGIVAVTERGAGAVRNSELTYLSKPFGVLELLRTIARVRGAARGKA